MNWISFFDRQPEDGQHIWYYGEHIGVWAGEYCYATADQFSPHLIFCHESPGVVDRMDAPWWMPRHEGISKPQKPATDYPKDYPNGK